MIGKTTIQCCAACIGIALSWPSIAQEDEPTTAASGLLELELEDLIQVEVSTVSRRKEPKSQTPAAVTVLTQEDIRRSGKYPSSRLPRMP